MRALILVAVAVAVALPAFAQAPAVVVDDLQVGEGSTAVSYHLTGAFDEETAERIHSGLEVRFQHRIELLAPRKWVAFRVLGRKIAAATSVESRVSYDAVTERYALFRQFDQRGLEAAAEPILRDTASFDEAKAWLTHPDPVELYHPGSAIRPDNVLLNIEVVVGRRWLAWIIPAPRTVRERRTLAP